MRSHLLPAVQQNLHLPCPNSQHFLVWFSPEGLWECFETATSQNPPLSEAGSLLQHISELVHFFLCLL